MYDFYSLDEWKNDCFYLVPEKRIILCQRFTDNFLIEPFNNTGYPLKTKIVKLIWIILSKVSCSLEVEGIWDEVPLLLNRQVVSLERKYSGSIKGESVCKYLYTESTRVTQKRWLYGIYMVCFLDSGFHAIINFFLLDQIINEAIRWLYLRQNT